MSRSCFGDLAARQIRTIRAQCGLCPQFTETFVDENRDDFFNIILDGYAVLSSLYIRKFSE